MSECNEKCPRCKRLCNFPHGYQQEEYIATIVPKGYSVHSCNCGNDWLVGCELSGIDDILEQARANDRPKQPKKYQSRSTYLTPDGPTRSISLEDVDKEE